MSQVSVVKGSCLCGGVKISTTNINHHIGACHCSMCRKWGGAALLAVECDNSISFEGEENITIYQSSAWAERGFCNKCGSHLFYRLKEKNHYYVPVGIFDNDESLVFDLEVFIEEKPKYYTFSNETKKMTGEELITMFQSSASE
ncbi:MAG: GFA family protein [Xenococcaceae cyanobacterium MO_188.B19]|nr:GFA family protein [Xenococcaceae cyanobacterium MO_188.B19]